MSATTKVLQVWVESVHFSGVLNFLHLQSGCGGIIPCQPQLKSHFPQNYHFPCMDPISNWLQEKSVLFWAAVKVGTIFSVRALWQRVLMCAHTHTRTHTRIVADLLAQLICVGLHLDPTAPSALLLHCPAAFSSFGPECVQLYMKSAASPSLWWSVIKVEW